MIKSAHLPGVTALRLFAALTVMVGHIEMMKNLFHLHSLWSDLNSLYTSSPIVHVFKGDIPWPSPFITHLGSNAVVFFFVLSGFLITHLLLQESRSLGQFSISAFYKRRAIRIWPLYLLMVFFAFGIGAIHWPIFFLPNQPDWGSNQHFLEKCYFFFSPNIALLFIPAIGMVAHLWSIGVEEHFYLFWPWFLRIVKKNKNIILTFGATWILIKIMLKLIITQFQLPLQSIALYFIFNKFECMALGGYLAYILQDEGSKPKSFLKKNLSWLMTVNVLLYFLATYLLPEKWANFNYLLVAGFSGLLLLKVMQSHEKSFLNHPWINRLGNASYAIYMVHFPVLLVILNTQYPTGHSSTLGWLQNIGLYSQAMGYSLLLGMALHHWIELPLKKLLMQ